MSIMRKAGATIALTGSLLLAGGALAGPASAANQRQDGLVNVAIGDITIQDVNVGVAATIAAQVCGINVGPVQLLARQVDATNVSRTVCDAPQTVVLTQN